MVRMYAATLSLHNTMERECRLIMLSRFVPDGLRRNSAIISRIVAAALGGYLLTSAASVLIAFLLPMTHAHAVLTMLLMSFAIWSAVVIWVYATPSLKKIWTVIGIGLAISLSGSALFHLLGVV